MTEVSEPSASPHGVCVLVDGVVVAWFAEFTAEAQMWCTENYFGQWLTWRAAAPVPIPLTEEEMRDVKRRAQELADVLGFQGGLDDLHGNEQVKVPVCNGSAVAGMENGAEPIEEQAKEGTENV